MGFFDLNIAYHEPSRSGGKTAGDKTARIKLATKAMELGYTGIAYNRSITGVMSDKDRCSIPLLTVESLAKAAPALATSIGLHRDLLGVPRDSPFRQYSRLTVLVESNAQGQALNSGNPILKGYDIVAVRPLNQSAFDYACEKAEVHMISIDCSDKMPFRLKLPMVKAAIRRGIYFEITYSDLLANAQMRRQVISNAKLLVDWTRGKHLIITSGAPAVTELRGPIDVVNLSSLLGLSTERAKAAISRSCRTMIANAMKKKYFYKEAIRVELASPSDQFNLEKPSSFDWLKWDPLSSGDGDMLLDDLAKAFSSKSTAPEVAKAVDFTSVIDNISSQGFQVKDILSGMKSVTDNRSSLGCEMNHVSSQPGTVLSDNTQSVNVIPGDESVCQKLSISSDTQMLDFSEVLQPGSAIAKTELVSIKRCSGQEPGTKMQVTLSNLDSEVLSEPKIVNSPVHGEKVLPNFDEVLDAKKVGMVEFRMDLDKIDYENVLLPLSEITKCKELKEGHVDDSALSVESFMELKADDSSATNHENNKDVVMVEDQKLKTDDMNSKVPASALNKISSTEAECVRDLILLSQESSKKNIVNDSSASNHEHNEEVALVENQNCGEGDADINIPTAPVIDLVEEAAVPAQGLINENNVKEESLSSRLDTPEEMMVEDTDTRTVHLASVKSSESSGGRIADKLGGNKRMTRQSHFLRFNHFTNHFRFKRRGRKSKSGRVFL